VSKFAIPALVAAFVTLVIEYLAKPSLEVRKDRLLEASRATRRAVAAFERCCVQVGRVAVHVADGETWDFLRAKAYEDLATDGDVLTSELFGTPQLAPHVERALMGFAAAVKIIEHHHELGSSAAVVDAAFRDRVQPYCDVAADALALRWYQFRATRAVIARLDDLDPLVSKEASEDQA
jgi:hypothetical protein